MLNNSWEEGMLAQSQRVGLITLICKDLSQSDKLNFWRPMSLLNTDYKILSKQISVTLRVHMSEISAVATDAKSARAEMGPIFLVPLW